MKTATYTALRQLGFQEIDSPECALKAFELGQIYVEIIPRDWGLSIQIYGGGFSDHYPANYDVCKTSDLPEVINQIKAKLPECSQGEEMELILFED